MKLTSDMNQFLYFPQSNLGFQDFIDLFCFHAKLHVLSETAFETFS